MLIANCPLRQGHKFVEVGGEVKEMETKISTGKKYIYYREIEKYTLKGK